jgi:hypothetical protein
MNYVSGFQLGSRIVDVLGLPVNTVEIRLVCGMDSEALIQCDVLVEEEEAEELLTLLQEFNLVRKEDD